MEKKGEFNTKIHYGLFYFYVIFRIVAAVIFGIIGIHLMDLGYDIMVNSSNIKFVSGICNATILSSVGYCPDTFSIGLSSGAIGLAFVAIAISLFLSLYSDFSVRKIQTDIEEIKKALKIEKEQ